MKKFITILLCTSIIFGATACGDSTVTSGVTDTEIKVANSAATSGAYAPVGVPFNAGIEAYFAMTNEGGGVDGRKITFLHEDDEFDPVKGKAYLEKFINDDKVFSIVGHFGTPVVSATLEDIKAAGIPAVYFATGIGKLYNEKAEGADKVIFPVQPIYQTEGSLMTARGKSEFNAAKIGVIYTNDDAGKDLLWGVENKAKELGIEVVSQQVTVGSSDVSAAVTAIKQANVDLVVAAQIQATVPTVIKELAAQGVNKPVITTYVNASEAISKAVATEVGQNFDVYANAWVDITGEREAAYKLYVDNMKKFAGSDEYANNPYAMTGWIAGHVFVEGLKAVDGDLTRESYMAALEKAPIQNPFGGQVDFTNGKRVGTEEMSLMIMDPTKPGGWVVNRPLQGMEEILAGKPAQ